MKVAKDKYIMYTDLIFLKYRFTSWSELKANNHDEQSS